MSAAQNHVYRAPFDAVAASYDAVFTSSLIGKAQRSAVWNELASAFRPGDRLLEIGCGTGIDACFLAERGIQVVACDPSPQMIEMTARNLRGRNLQTMVRPRVLSAEDLGSLPEDESFDGAFSNFGALNCVPDLGRLAVDLGKLLRPGASVLLCWMPPHCAWETMYFLSQGNRDKAFRRQNGKGIDARIAGETFVRVHYPSLKSLTRAFAPAFQLQSVKGIGVAVPPSYLEQWARRHPRMLGLCTRFDSLFAKCPGLRVIGDHVLVRLQRSLTNSGSGHPISLTASR